MPFLFTFIQYLAGNFLFFVPSLISKLSEKIQYMSNYPKFTQGWNFTTKVKLTLLEEAQSTFPVFIPFKYFVKQNDSIVVFKARNGTKRESATSVTDCVQACCITSALAE